MALAAVTTVVEEIGTMAGMVWGYLNDHETTTLSKLAREIDAPRDLVMQGVGWLAREGKVQIQQTARGKQISLT
jgi:hypothetical protein